MPKSPSDLLDALTIHSSLPDNQIEMDQMHQTNDGQPIDPTSSALCMLVGMVASQRTRAFLPQILHMKGRAEIKIELILIMLDQIPSSQPDGDNNDSLYHAAIEMLLQNIDSVPFLRFRLRSNPLLFTNVPFKLSIPAIVQYMVTKYGQRKSDSGLSSSASLLCNIVVANANRGCVEDLIGCLVSSLQSADRKEVSQESQTAFFNKNGPLWRLALLDESSSSDSAYKEILVATAKLMIEMPSSTTPLALLASLVDNQFSLRLSEDYETVRLEKRICIASFGIIHFAMNQISPSHNDDSINEGSIFSRLAPLLILRRMPRSYYSAVHKACPSDRNTFDIVTDLTAFLSKSLRAHAVRNDQSNLAREEKKLLAELAGHCLPFSNQVNCELHSSPGSIFENFCAEPFSNTLQVLLGERQNTDKSDVMDENEINCVDQYPDISTIVSIRQAKAALYAVSHHVPLGLDEENGEALVDVASFVFEVLNFQNGHACGTASTILLREEINMLQSGCSHFLIISVDSLSCRKAKHQSGPPEQHPLIEHVDRRMISEESTARSHTFLGALFEVLRTLVSSIITGESAWSTRQFAPSSRTALLNSICMLTQGSRAEDGRLAWLAANILPTLVEWTNSGPIDDDIHHALCIAASLQVMYTLLARCGSFDFIGSELKKADFARRTLQCALKSFHTGEGNATSVSALLRLASLKVILTVIALDRASGANSHEYGRELSGCLSPVEFQRAMSALHGAANVDQDPDVRRLAGEILPYLHVTN